MRSRAVCSSWSPSGSESLLNTSYLAGSPRSSVIVLSIPRPVHNTKVESLGARRELLVSGPGKVGFVCEFRPIRRAPRRIDQRGTCSYRGRQKERRRRTVRFTGSFSVLLAAMGCERLVETADLAGCPVRVDYALGRGLVVLPLGLVSDPAGPLFIPRFDGPVEALGEVAKAGPDTLVVGATLEALLVAF